MCRFEQGEHFFPGVIAAINSDGTYAVDYDDGDKEGNVSPECISILHSCGEYVDVIYGDVEKYRGRVISIDADGGHLVRFTDGSIARGITSEYLQRAHDSGPLQVGDVIEALYASGEVWYPGKLLPSPRAYATSSTTMATRKKKSTSQRTCGTTLGTTKPSAWTPSFKARMTFMGTVEAVNDDFTYAIVYDDGDRDEALGAEFIARAGRRTVVSPA